MTERIIEYQKATPNIVSPAAKMPWEDRPANCSDVIWRYDANPVIPRDLIPCSNSIFNSAVVPFKGKYAGVFRCDDKRRFMRLHAGFSDDGITWHIDHAPIRFTGSNAEISDFVYGYDPRVCWIDDRYYLTWCNGYHGPTIGMAWTLDFKVFNQMENAFLPFNRNGVLIPKRINNKYYMLSRPSGPGHNDFGDIFCSESLDLNYWGNHRFVMGTGKEIGWETTKIGAGPVPIETEAGWLLFYHGVLTSCSGFTYSFGAALLDLKKPWKVIGRGQSYLLSPQKLYECVGDVPNVVFPCSTLYDDQTGRIAIYYGCADTVTGLAFCYAQDVINFIKSDPL